MTLISPDALSGLMQPQTAMSKLTIGAKLIVDVLGPTRHGLAVRVGSDAFLLNARAELPDAKNLTLKVTERTSGTEHKVQILASNDQLLAKPVRGELTSRPLAPVVQSASATIAEDHQIEVNARPVASDGRVLGPALVVRLATKPAAGFSETNQLSNRTIGSNPPDAAAVGRPLAEQPSGKPASMPFPHVMDVEKAVAKLPLASNVEARAVSAPPQQSSTAPTTSAPTVLAPTSSAPSRPVPPVFVPTGSAPIGPVPTASAPAKAVSEQQVMPPRTMQGVMTVTVAGRAPDGGQVFLQVADDLLMKIEQQIDLPIGTTLQMTLTTKSMNIAPPLYPGSSMEETSPLTKLIELLDDIEQSGGRTGEHREPAVVRRLPMPDRHLAAKLLQLIGLQMGPGFEEAGMVAHDRDSVGLSKAHQLQSLLSDISNMASEPLADGWRSTILPLGTDPAQAVMIHHREHNTDPDSDDDESDMGDAVVQRAVFDVNFSRLGRCQIDALCQEQRFDLLVRSERPLDHGRQQEITDLFLSACEIAGLRGEIGYRHGQFVEPAKMLMSTRTVTT